MTEREVRNASSKDSTVGEGCHVPRKMALCTFFLKIWIFFAQYSFAARGGPSKFEIASYVHACTSYAPDNI